MIQGGKDVCILPPGRWFRSRSRRLLYLRKKGVSVRVVNICSIKPIDEKMIVKCAKECDTLVSIEDHNIIGGLGSAISEVLTDKCPQTLHRLE